MIVLLDTSAIIPNYRFDSTMLKLLLEAANRANIELLLPRVVVEELLDNFRKALRSEAKAAQRLNKLLSKPIQALGKLDIDKETELYRTWLSTHDTIRIAELPYIATDELLARIIKQEKPFGESGKGVKDYLIWQTALDHLTHDPDEPLVFVAVNSNDFCSANGDLHSDLLRDVAEHSASGAFLFYSSYGEFHSNHIIQSLDRLDTDKAADLLKSSTIEVERWLYDKGEEAINMVGLEPDQILPGVDVTEAEVLKIKNVKLERVNEVLDYGKGLIYIRCQLSANLMFELSGPVQIRSAAEESSSSASWRSVEKVAHDCRIYLDIIYDTQANQMMDIFPTRIDRIDAALEDCSD